jgi:hypothetical protein
VRRKNLDQDGQGDKPDPNNVLMLLFDMPAHIRSLLLATATPLQLYPIEARDLFDGLAVGNEHVLGNAWSHWRHAEQALDLIMHQRQLPADDLEEWGWMRNPLPPCSEGRDFEIIRRSLRLPDQLAVAYGMDWRMSDEPDKLRLHRLGRDFAPAPSVSSTYCAADAGVPGTHARPRNR